MSLVKLTVGLKALKVPGANGTVGTFATAAALQAARPAASFAGAVGLVGTAAPYARYLSDGVQWAVQSSGPGSSLVIADEGAQIGTPAILNFTGPGATAVLAGSQVNVDIPVGPVRNVPEVSNATLKASLRSALDGVGQNEAMPVKRGARVLAIFDTAANVVQSGTGTAAVTDESADPYAGATGVRSVWADASARVLTPAVTNQPYYSSGIDLTGLNVEFTFKRLSTSTQALGTGLSVCLYSDASTPAAPGANRLQLTLDTAYGDPALNDDWQTISIPIERFNVVGTGANITSIKMANVRRGGQSGTFAVELGNIQAVPRQLRKAVCCICISDNRADTWTNANRVLSRYGFPAIAQPGRIASNLQSSLNEFNMSPRELRKLQQIHGWQIGSQAFTTESAGAFDNYTDEQFVAEFSGIPRLYRALGLWGAADGSYNPAIPVTAVKWIQLLRQIFRSMRVSYTHSSGQVPWPETSPIADPMRLKSWSRGASNDGAQLIAYVQKAVQTKGMAVFSIHTWAADEPALVALCDWLAANRNDVDVVTIDTAIERMRAATFNALDGGPPVVDTTPPQFTAFSISNLTPAVINVTLSKAYSGTLPAAGAFPVTVAGAARTVNSADAVDSTHFNLTLASAVASGQAVTAAYDKPVTNPLQDALGNQTPSLAATAVTNSVAPPATAVPLQVGTLSNITESGDGTTGWSYANLGGGTSLNGTGVTALSFAAADSGYVQWRNGVSGNGAHYVGFKTASGASGFAAFVVGARSVNPTSSLYRIVTGGTDSLPTVELTGVAGDYVRLVLDRTAATVTLMVARQATPNDWTTVHTFTGVAASRFYVGINLSGANTNPIADIRHVGMT